MNELSETLSYIWDAVKYLIQGSKWTLIVFAFTLAFSIPFGLLGATLKKSKIKPLVFLLDIYTWVVRGTPLLLQLFLVVYGIPMMFQLGLDPFPLALFTFVINYTGYFIEIFRGGINTIKPGQWEACQMLGMTKTQTYVRVILPQAFKKVLPSITNEAVNLIKDTALLAAIAIGDILFNAQEMVSLDFRFEAYFVAFGIYLLISYVIFAIFKAIEKRYSFYN